MCVCVYTHTYTHTNISWIPSVLYPIINLSVWGPPLGCTLFQSLLSDIQPLYNHIKDNG